MSDSDEFEDEYLSLDIENLRDAVELIHEFEGCRLEPYLCPSDRPTIGWGNTFYEDEMPVSMNDKPITQERADELSEFWILDFAYKVEEDLIENGRAPNKYELGAFTSLAYNIGFTAWKNSTARKYFLNYRSRDSIVEWIQAWNKSGGEVLAGLVRRREKESELFNKGLDA